MEKDHSPTELAEEISDDEDWPEVKEEGQKGDASPDVPGGSRGRKSKNKRGRKDEGSDGSPEKRREGGDADLPVTGRELRRLLAGHLRDVKSEVRGAWKEMDERIENVAKDVGMVASEVKKEKDSARGVTERVRKLEVLENETRKNFLQK